MPNYNSQLQSNNADLQTVLQALQGKAAGANAVLYTEQILTEEQKAQARANIGAAKDIGEFNSEKLDVVRVQSYPSVTTFEYTEGDGVYGYSVAKRGTIPGGYLCVDWDTDDIYDFGFNLYIYDSNGNPYLATDGANSVSRGAAFQGQLFSPTYKQVGVDSIVGFGSAHSPFSVKIPDGCTFIVCVRATGGEEVWGNITSASEFGQWCISGGLTFTVSTNLENREEPSYIVRASINQNINSVNHRGYGTAPENTLAAYRLSKEMGFDMVECDVSLTSDGIPVLLHDATIDRTSNGSGNISNLTLAQVRSYDFGSWKSAKYAGEPIPTFEEFISLCRTLGLHPYIELKASGNYAQSDVDNMITIVKKYGMLNKVTWISFSYTYLEYVSNTHSQARLGYICGSDITESQINSAAQLLNDKNEVFIDAYETISDDLATLCINANIPVEVWGADTIEKIKSANNYISGFTTDTVIAGVELYNETLSGQIPVQTPVEENGLNLFFCPSTVVSGVTLVKNNPARALMLSLSNETNPPYTQDGTKPVDNTKDIYPISIPDGATTITVECPTNIKWAYRNVPVGTNASNFDSGWLSNGGGSTYTIPDGHINCLLVFGCVADETILTDDFDASTITVTFE